MLTQSAAVKNSIPSQSPAETAPFELLAQISCAYWLSRCLHVVADIGVADALEEEPQSVAALAEFTGCHKGALDRVLRLLSSHGIFRSCNGGYLHTPASRVLRTDHPRSVRSFVRMSGLPILWESYGSLEFSLRTGTPSSEKVIPGGLWSYFAKNPEACRIFNEGMASKSQGQIAGVLGSYSFAEFGTVGDIGGGRGHLLQAVLSAEPKATGVLFDLPHVIEKAANVASERLRLQSGNFFSDPLPVCDAYLLMDVVNTWSDENTTKLLKNMRRSAPSHARLLLIEAVIPENSAPTWSKLLDIQMLTMLSGRQRTLQEHSHLLDEAGFCLVREIAAGGGKFSILESVVK
jgi:O-methyltransferase domain